MGEFWNGVGNNILGANENVGPSIGLLIFSITDVLIIDGTVRNTLTVLSLSTRNLEVSALNTAAAATLATLVDILKLIKGAVGNEYFLIIGAPEFDKSILGTARTTTAALTLATLNVVVLTWRITSIDFCSCPLRTLLPRASLTTSNALAN